MSSGALSLGKLIEESGSRNLFDADEHGVRDRKVGGEATDGGWGGREGPLSKGSGEGQGRGKAPHRESRGAVASSQAVRGGSISCQEQMVILIEPTMRRARRGRQAGGDGEAGPFLPPDPLGRRGSPQETSGSHGSSPQSGLRADDRPSSICPGRSSAFPGRVSTPPGRATASPGRSSTSLRGSSTSLRGSSTSPRGSSTSLRGFSTSLRGFSTSLGGSSTSPRGSSTSPRGFSTSHGGIGNPEQGGSALRCSTLARLPA